MARKQRAQTQPTSGRRRGRLGDRYRPRKYTRINVENIDYKDLNTLRRFISDRGKIRSRRITGACRRHQNQVATAVKRARELALLPYVSEPVGGGEREGGRRDRGDRDRDR
jgi:small subunit ribosomal protein S18